MDGLYEVRYGTTDVQTDDFWSKINAFLENPAADGNVATASTGTLAGLQALKLDTSCTLERDYYRS